MIRYLLTLFLGCCGLAAPLGAQPIQSLEAIQDSVQHFLHNETSAATGQLVIEVGRIDNRLRLDACERSPEVFWPDGMARRVGNVTVGVRCDSPTWSLFVRARVEMHEAILISTRSLSRGTHISAEDIESGNQDITRFTAGYFTDPNEIVGRILTRSVRAGTVMNPSLVKLASVIQRGQRVTILAGTGSFQVRMEGESLSDGAMGEMIRVRNLSSRQEIEAEVIGAGMVQVRM